MKEALYLYLGVMYMGVSQTARGRGAYIWKQSDGERTLRLYLEAFRWRASAPSSSGRYAYIRKATPARTVSLVTFVHSSKADVHSDYVALSRLTSIVTSENGSIAVTCPVKPDIYRGKTPQVTKPAIFEGAHDLLDLLYMGYDACHL